MEKLDKFEYKSNHNKETGIGNEAKPNIFDPDTEDLETVDPFDTLERDVRH